MLGLKAGKAQKLTKIIQWRKTKMAVDNKKEQERDELHRAIWAIADELRGAVDGWDFKTTCLEQCFTDIYPKI